jgi:outer membrane protein
VSMAVQQARIGIIQGKSQVEAAEEAVRLAQLTLEGERKKLEVGISTSYNVVLRERDLVTAQYAEVQALDTYVKALVALDQATGTTLDRNGVQLNDALTGTVTEKPVSPFHANAPQPPQGANR